MRIGVNTGDAVVGNFGSHTKFDYTMLGDAVNLAARLEGANKLFGTYTMISEFTREQTGDAFASRELARLAVVGRKEPVVVHEPMFLEEYESRKVDLEAFAEGLSLFYEGAFAEARARFESIAEIDSAAAAYGKKCGEWERASLENWKGVWVMTSK